tara:strand:- start:350 stop:1030 length:681 start_codon:yes stop_codon:yes gene_type:complete
VCGFYSAYGLFKASETRKLSGFANFLCGNLVRGIGMALICASFGISWLRHNSWSQTYVGLRKLVNEVLPNGTSKIEAEDAALCQLAVISANQLMEIALFDLLKRYIKAPQGFNLSEKLYENSGYYFAITELSEKAVGKMIDLSKEPFISTERLRKRRNATVHKSSALADIAMAQSALYTAVQGVKALCVHFNEPKKYDVFLKAYPLENGCYFSQIVFPEDRLLVKK